MVFLRLFCLLSEPRLMASLLYESIPVSVSRWGPDGQDPPLAQPNSEPGRSLAESGLPGPEWGGVGWAGLGGAFGDKRQSLMTESNSDIKILSDEHKGYRKFFFKGHPRQIEPQRKLG